MKFRTLFIALVAMSVCPAVADAGPLRDLVFGKRTNCPNGNCANASRSLPPTVTVTVTVQPTVAAPAVPPAKAPAVKVAPAVAPAAKPATPAAPKPAAPSATATSTTTKTTTVVVVGAPNRPILNTLAQTKAEIQARLGRVFHPGGGFGAGRYEGCGFSTVSADHAVRSCCYWGKRQPLEIGVARGLRGWFATVIYR